MQEDTSHIHRSLVRMTTMSPTLLLMLMIPMIVSLLSMIMSSMRMRMTHINALPRRCAHRPFMRRRDRSTISSIMRSLDDVRSELSRVNEELVLCSFRFSRRVGVGSRADDGGIGRGSGGLGGGGDGVGVGEEGRSVV